MTDRFLWLVFAAVLLPGPVSPQDARAEWDSIKAHALPVVAPAFQGRYGVPYRQPLADYGWEDGLEISRDGLHLYALYFPGDLFGWNNYLLAHIQDPPCTWYGNLSFKRPYAGTYGMDFTTNVFGCDSAVNIDILYSHRNSLADSFKAWQLSGIARGGAMEGGPAPLFSATDPLRADLFLFTGNGDIWMIKNTGANPSGISGAVRLPAPINPDSNEFTADNAFVQRLADDTVILVYERYVDPGVRTFMVALSPDTGNTWGIPSAVTSVNNGLGHIEHPCLHKDSVGQWWLYFSIDYTTIVRARQAVPGDWDSWEAPETIVSKGNALVIGEPTVTRDGAISFSLGYQREAPGDSFDVYDLDPWYLPLKNESRIGKAKVNAEKEGQLLVSPVPAVSTLRLNVEGAISVFDACGCEVKCGKGRKTVDVSGLPGGVYFLRIRAGAGYLEKRFVVLR